MADDSIADGFTPSQRKRMRLCLSRKRKIETSTRVVQREACIDADLSKQPSEELVSAPCSSPASSSHEVINARGPSLVSIAVSQTTNISACTESASKSSSDCSLTTISCVPLQPVAYWQKPPTITNTNQTKLSQFFRLTLSKVQTNLPSEQAHSGASSRCGSTDHSQQTGHHPNHDNMDDDDDIFTDAELIEALDKSENTELLHSLSGLSKHSSSASFSTTNKPVLRSSTGSLPRSVQPVAKTTSQYNRYKRQCPLYKWIPGTTFTVDAFSYGAIPKCTAYFLSHFHYDHYQGLTRHFKHDIYCSQATGNLVVSQLKVDSSLVHILPLNSPVTVNGVEVLLLDANHCPGSVMFLFKLSNDVCHLHTGDFRPCKSMQHCPSIARCRVDTLFLDTTYCSSQYDFPTQESVVQFAVDRTLQFLASKPATLIVCGTYTIGKEKIFLAIAEILNCRAYVTKEKKRILDCLEDEHVSQLITSSSPSASSVHVLSMNKLNMEELERYRNSFNGQYSAVLAFKPTGWTYSKKLTSLAAIKPFVRGSVTIYGIPYSEHSSYSELRDMVQFLSPKHVVSTVGGAAARKSAETQCRLWLSSNHHYRDTSVQATLDHLLLKSTS